jgi:hypothetical protein
MNATTKFAVAAAVAGVGWYLWKRHTAPPPAPAAPVQGLNGPAGFVQVRSPVWGALQLVSHRPLNGRGAAGGVSGMGSFWDDLTDMARLSIIAPLSLVDTHLRPKVAADIRSLPGGGHLPLLPGTHVTPISPQVAAIPDTSTDSATPTGIVWDGVPGDPGDPNLIAEQAAAASSAGQGAPGSAYRAPAPAGKFNPLLAGAAAVVAIPVLFLVGKK